MIPHVEVSQLIIELGCLSKQDTIQRPLEVAWPEQRATHNLDNEQFLALVDVTESFGPMAKKINI